MKPLVSVVLPCYNVSEYLSDCMQSLEQQTIGIENLELIFVDDASTDDGKTWNRILEFERKWPSSVVAIHSDENRCQGGARNLGISYAHAAYVGFVDPDDWIEPDMYAGLYQCIVNHQCDAADCRVMWNMPDGKEYVREDVKDCLLRFEKAVIDGGTHWTHVFTTGGTYGGGCVTGIYRRELLQKPGVYFPERLKYEDNYWESMLLLYVSSFYHLGRTWYHYRQRDTSTVHAQNETWHLDRMEIERMKLLAYRDLGVYERFYHEIEWDFLGLYYLNTLHLLWSRYDKPPYSIFTEMTDTVKRLFPSYKSNPYLQQEEGSINWILINLIDKKLNERQFLEAGKIILSFCAGESMEE